MMSLRKEMEQVLQNYVGENLGNGARKLMVVFSIILLVLVGVVFITSPAAILNDLTGINKNVVDWDILYII